MVVYKTIVNGKISYKGPNKNEALYNGELLFNKGELRKIHIETNDGVEVKNYLDDYYQFNLEVLKSYFDIIEIHKGDGAMEHKVIKEMHEITNDLLNIKKVMLS